MTDHPLPPRTIPTPSTCKLAFLFTGQGAHYVGMGHQLYQSHELFRQTLDVCADLLADSLAVPLQEALFSDSGAASPLDNTEYAQPALFALEYALAMLWRSWGIVPDVVMGHSLGEYTAACVAGIMDLETSLRLVAKRGELMGSLPAEGEMAVVFAGVEEIEPLLEPFAAQVSIAAINGPSNTVISGQRAAVNALLDQLEEEFITGRPLNISIAAHSPLTQPILAPFEAFAQGATFRAPSIPLVSNLFGRLLHADEVPDASFWRRHIREPVRFSAGIQALYEAGCDTFLEIGPSDTLIKMGQKCAPQGFGHWLASLHKEQPSWQRLRHSAMQLAEAGFPLDRAAFARDTEKV